MQRVLLIFCKMPLKPLLSFPFDTFLITGQMTAALAPASPPFDPLPSLSQLLLLLLTQVKGFEPLEDASPEPLLD